MRWIFAAKSTLGSDVTQRLRDDSYSKIYLLPKTYISEVSGPQTLSIK